MEWQHLQQCKSQKIMFNCNECIQKIRPKRIIVLFERKLKININRALVRDLFFEKFLLSTVLIGLFIF